MVPKHTVHAWATRLYDWDIKADTQKNALLEAARRLGQMRKKGNIYKVGIDSVETIEEGNGE